MVTVKKPSHVRIRSYNVGFGDCFLMTFRYRAGEQRHVLIDFGSTRYSGNGPGSALTIARQIKNDTEGKLHMVVATHRHADHISGFGGASGEIIAGLDPDVVVQPWTEDPDLEPDATAPALSAGRTGARAFTSRLSDMQALAGAILRELPNLEASASVPKTLSSQLRFLGETNIKNEAAVRGLMTMGRRKPIYASAGQTLRVASLLPGVKIHVLGPPTLRQSKAISEQRSVDSDEFWHLAHRPARGRDGRQSRLFPRAAVATRIPQEARWVIPKIDEMQAEEMLSIVRTLDSVLNNTSLILLFEVGGTRLLFPGDAQIENWSYPLFNANGRNKIRRQLASARFYKVGHHGSLNATPKTLWRSFTRAGEDSDNPTRLITMVSTLAGKHGSDSRGTEVPRKVLIDELRRLSDFRSTQTLRSKKAFWHDVELKV
jgi:hypothetical protein